MRGIRVHYLSQADPLKCPFGIGAASQDPAQHFGLPRVSMGGRGTLEAR